MATRAALAVMREVAIKQINAAADRLAGVAGIEPVQIPAHSRDLEHLQAYQLDALSGWLTALADVVAPVADVDPAGEATEGKPTPAAEAGVPVTGELLDSNTVTDAHGIPESELPPAGEPTTAAEAKPKAKKK